VDTGALTLTIAVILILGLIWAAVLIPPILRARSQQPRNDSVGDFHYKLSMLGHTNGTHRKRPDRVSTARPAFAPAGRSPAKQSQTQKRRQDVLFILIGISAGTLFLALLSRMPVLFAANLIADALLAGYVYLLIQYKQRTSEQQSKVRFLNTAYRTPAPYMVGHLSSNGTSESTGPRLVPLRRTASN
jgi:uncharacterized membrane protein YciS (DUF1049 family)